MSCINVVVYVITNNDVQTSYRLSESRLSSPNFPSETYLNMTRLSFVRPLVYLYPTKKVYTSYQSKSQSISVKRNDPMWQTNQRTEKNK